MRLVFTRLPGRASHERDLKMFFDNNYRSSTVTIASALITAILFVSAAVGPIPLLEPSGSVNEAKSPN
jgi:hypothetical protein